MSKALRAPVGAVADDEDSGGILDAEERVERHHEAAFRLAAAPGTRDRLEVGPELGVDLAGMYDPAAIEALRQRVG